MIGGLASMRKNNKFLTLYAVFLALGVMLNYIEHLIPLPTMFPGVKLGLSNALGLIVLYYLGKNSYVFFGILRVTLSALLFTGFGSTFLISLGGTLMASLITVILVSFTKSSIFGISASGAVFHGLGQIFVVSLLYGTIQMIWYMCILVISGVITGILMASVSVLLIQRLPTKLI